MYVSIFYMIMQMLGGLGLLLFGMKLLGDGLELAAGAKMKNLVGKFTKNKYVGAAVGTIITAVIQSSSATTVMVVGLVNAQIMTLAQASGVIMGANIGTTVTGLIIALKIEIIAPVAIFCGVISMLFFNNKFCKSIGQVISGFGILFLGINIMSASMKPLSQLPEFINILTIVSNPIVGILVGAIFTAIIQSSSVSIGVLQAMGSSGVISLPNAIFIIFGQNIGTCITSILSSIGTNKTAKRTAVVHLMFNVLVTIIFVLLAIFAPFAEFIEKIVANNVMMQIATVHIMFNVLGTCIMLPMSNLLIKISYLIIPGEDPKKEAKDFMYLDDRILSTPPVAVKQIFKEVERMGTLAKINFDLSLDILLNSNHKIIPILKENEEVIDFLNSGITSYLIKINGLDLDDINRKSIGNLYHVVNDIERIADHSENICNLYLMINSSKVKFEQECIEDIQNLKKQIDSMIEHAYSMFKNGYEQADTLVGIKVKFKEEQIDLNVEKLKQQHIDKLNQGRYSPVFSIAFTDLLNNMERIADHADNIASSMLTTSEKEQVNSEIRS